ncbi:hypothetical protein E9993_01450 [Labilibacter sediminis]|nr:hypothetical protein E9993_01450 [Labilibacter sediminis]
MGVCSTYDQRLIKLLLPHRSPFLMVDMITYFNFGKNPSLRANYTVKNTDPLYRNNKSEDHLHSMYITEGLGQCCNLLIVILAIEKELTKANIGFKSLDELFNGFVDDEPDETIIMLKSFLNKRLMQTYSNVGFLGSADMEVNGYARPGQVISYEVHLNQTFRSLFYSKVRACINNIIIAHGTLVSADGKN